MIEAGDLELDVAAHVVRRDGAEVHLTPTEFDLLKALMVNRGRLMTHAALLKEVWGPAYAEDVATLRTHMANLRRKVEPRDGPTASTRSRASATASAALNPQPSRNLDARSRTFTALHAPGDHDSCHRRNDRLRDRWCRSRFTYRCILPLRLFATRE